MPRFKFLGYTIIGPLLCVCFILIFTPNLVEMKSNPNSQVGFWFLILFPIGALITSIILLFKLFSARVASLVDNNIVLFYPFLLLKEKIPLQNIVKVIEEDYTIETNHEGSKYTIHHGRKSYIFTKEKRKYRIDSFRTSSYYKIIERLNVLGKDIGFDVLNTENLSSKKNKGYGFLIFMFLFFCMIMSAVIHNWEDINNSIFYIFRMSSYNL